MENLNLKFLEQKKILIIDNEVYIIELIQTMIDDYGYTAESAEEVLIYASNNLWRDS